MKRILEGENTTEMVTANLCLREKIAGKQFRQNE